MHPHALALFSIVLTGSALLGGCSTVPTQTGPRCSATVQKTVTHPNTTFHVQYVEPNIQANGEPISTLSHTTIFIDTGSGSREYAKRTASSPKGGKTVDQEITVPLSPGQSATVKVCVTATNAAGESAPTP